MSDKPAIAEKNTPSGHCAILIVNWNSWELLVGCLEALARQTYKNFQVFVADNASREPAPENLFSLFPEVIFVENKLNHGFAAGNNRLAALAAKFEWLLLLNPDAFPEPLWLEELIKASQKHPEYSSFSSRLMQSETICDGDGDCYHVSGLAWRYGHGKTVDNENTPEEIFAPCAAAAMYRTKDFLSVGGFDEDFFCYFEDVDLGFRMRLVGHRCLLVRTARVLHLGSATSGGRHSDFTVYHGHRNLVWTYIKNMPGILFWIFLPYHLLANIACVALHVPKGRGGIVIKAKIDALKKLPATWRKRRTIQAARKVSLGNLFAVMNKSLFPWVRPK